MKLKKYPIPEKFLMPKVWYDSTHGRHLTEEAMAIFAEAGVVYDRKRRLMFFQSHEEAVQFKLQYE